MEASKAQVGRAGATAFVLARTVTYAAMFIGLLLICVPGRVLSWFGVAAPATIDAPQIGGLIIGTAGAALALWCVLRFAFAGRGTPAPFDPPRRLVVRGPYRFVRNPMYAGAVLGLSGAALFYRSLALLGYAGLFLVAAHLFVVFYEEGALGQTFGQVYEAYRGRVGRWWPRHVNRG
jgi:protein-S-isoprenylcysteine O-methyltransferase Ste14